VENTQTASIAYQISCEHHMHNEVQFHHAANWTVYALQTEEEMPNGADATPLELIDSNNLTFVDLFDYRVSRNVVPHLTAVETNGSDKIRFANVHNFSMTRLAFDNTIVDRGRNVAVRTHDFTAFLLDNSVQPGKPPTLPNVLEPRATLQKLSGVGSFSNIAGLAEDGHGHLFFTDAVAHHVLRWNEDDKPAVVLTGAVDGPMSLGFAGDSALLAIDANKSVYAISTVDGHATKIAGEAQRNDTTLLLPTGFHNDVKSLQRMVGHEGLIYAPRSNMATMGVIHNEPRSFFYAPATSTAIMAGGSWKGLLQAAQLSPFKVGDSRYGVSEEDDKVYRLTLNKLDQLDAEPFVARGGTSVVTDTKCNVYVAGAQVFIYASTGKFLGTLEVPERPGSLAFGGPDRRSLYIGARTSMYSIRTTVPGN